MNKFTRRLLVLFLVLSALFTFLVNQNPPKDSIYVRHQLPDAELQALNIEKWATWQKEPSTFVWQFPELETIYVIKGEVYVTPDGSTKEVLIQQGDFATFAPGLRSVWRITKPFEKQVMLADTPFIHWYWITVFKSKAVLRYIKALF